MIERAEFAKVMGAFADRIGRALSPPTAEMYLELLGESLTTEEFLAGARIVFRAHTFNTWPAPQQFIDAVKPPTPVGLDAAEMFERVTKAVGTVYDNEGRRERLALLGPVAERAYRAAGGARQFLNVLEKDAPFLRKRFMEAYEGAVESAKLNGDAAAALSAGTPNPIEELLRDTTERIGQTMTKRLPATSLRDG